MRRFFVISFFMCLIICCKKSNSNTNPLYSGTGVLAGSDTTCGGWLIKTSGDTILDPVVIDSFPVTKKDGQAVKFTYHIPPNALIPGICLEGEPIQLVTLEDE